MRFHASVPHAVQHAAMRAILEGAGAGAVVVVCPSEAGHEEDSSSSGGASLHGASGAAAALAAGGGAPQGDPLADGNGSVPDGDGCDSATIASRWKP